LFSYSHACYNFSVKVSEIGEIALIEFISNIINESDSKKANALQKLIIGIGDDAAAWYSDNRIQLATVDALVENIHFTLDKTSWFELGWKALAVNLSDIAAMGGIPIYALVSLGLSPDIEIDDVLNLYKGMMKLARQQNMTIIGGDTDRTAHVSITITVLGAMRNNQHPLTRSSAKPGDLISVTGYLGTAAAGLEMLSKNLSFNSQTTKALKQAFFHPVPRIAEGQLFADEGVRTAIDISDGLFADLSHICHASHTGAMIEINKLPITSHVRNSFPDRALDFAISGGEDYELLISSNLDVFNKVKNAIKCPFTIIGKMTQAHIGEITFTDEKGNIVTPEKKGWEHFISK
jgi:thiamine-monophosphate kinase